MSDWLTDEQLNEAEQNLRMAYGGRPSAPVISKLIVQAREANRLRKGIQKIYRSSKSPCLRLDLKDLLEPKP